MHKVCKHCVYKKDAEGSTYLVGETVHNGRIIQHPPEFCNMDFVLQNLDNFQARESDIIIIDYSKAGTHWLYEILSILVSGKLEHSEQQKASAMLEFQSSFAGMDGMGNPRILDTHLRLQFLPETILDKVKIINLIRNPKSTAVSYYHHTKGLPFYQYTGTFSGYLPIYLEGYHNLYGSWFEMVTEYWEAFKGRSNVMTVFYEDLKLHPVKMIKGIADFLGLGRDAEFCEGVARLTAFDRMKNADQTTANSTSWKKHLRTGTIDDWKKHFTVAQNEMFDDVYRTKMKDFPDLEERIKFE